MADNIYDNVEPEVSTSLEMLWRYTIISCYNGMYGKQISFSQLGG